MDYLLISVCLFTIQPNDAVTDSNMVSYTPNKEIQVFQVPISKEPILSWMNVVEGIHPNTSAINSEIQIGTSLSILIYFYDRSKLYDMFVNNCVASNNETISNSKKIFMLYNDEDKDDSYVAGKINKWNAEKNVEKYTTLFYSNFTAFKFPDESKMFLTCNIELCYGRCKNKIEKTNEV